jgi:hypothetical protein
MPNAAIDVENNRHRDKNPGTLTTLPDSQREHLKRPVMWSVPPGGGSRSEGPAVSDGASGMTDDNGAEPMLSASMAVAKSVIAPPPAGVAIPGAAKILGRENPVDIETPGPEKSRPRNLGCAPGDVAYIELKAKLAAVIAADEKRRKLRADTPASTATQRKYRKLTRQLSAKLPEAGDRVVDVLRALSSYAEKANTFYAHGSALKFRSLRLIKRVAARMATGRPIRERELLAARHAVQLYRKLVRFSLDDARQLSGLNTVKAEGKKSVLRYFPGDWREQCLYLVSDRGDLGLAVALLRYTGLRPIELENGVHIQRISDHALQVVIAGAKVRGTHHGQRHRKFVLDTRLLAGWVSGFFGDQNARNFSFPADALRAELKKIGRAVQDVKTPAGGRRPTLSAYNFRHALTNEMRVDGFTEADIAGVLGHASADTNKLHYGQKVRRSRGGLSPVAVVRESIAVTNRIKPAKRSRATLKANLGIGPNAGLSSGLKSKLRR